MNKWVKRKWVQALRSGEYEQADGQLMSDHGDGEVAYCCLGVAIAECFPSAIIESKSIWSSNTLVVREGCTHPGIDLVADDLAIMWGLDYATQEALAEMNDEGKSFAEIANYIEREL